MRFASLLLCATALCAQQQDPYKDARKQPGAFELPGRSDADPADVSEVLLGYFGPSDPAHPEGGDVWQGAAMAIEDANREGGYRGKPFRLIARWSDNPWRAGAAFITQMVFQDRVWAIIGSIDGATTHLAEQVVAKALLPLVNPVATDRSLHLAGVPLLFSTVQGDDSHAAVLAGVLRDRTVVVLSATDHDSRAFLGQLKTRLKFHLQLDFDPLRADLSGNAREAIAAKPDAVVVIASARDSARAVKALRDAGYHGTIAGGPVFGRTAFLKDAGAAADDAIFPWVGAPTAAFCARFRERWGIAPGYASASAYDAVSILIQAIRRSGLNRGRIRDALASSRPYDGVSGRIEWDEYGQTRRPPVLVKFRAGSIVQ